MTNHKKPPKRTNEQLNSFFLSIPHTQLDFYYYIYNNNFFIHFFKDDFICTKKNCSNCSFA